MIDKHLAGYFLAFSIVVIGIIAFAVSDSYNKQTSNLADVLTSENICLNFEAVKNFDKPLPVVWKAKMDGCLVGCEGASFSRISEEGEYPRFAGYFSSEELSKIGPDDVLEIHGDWVGIDADHPATVFENKCVPIVQINKIERLNDRGQD